MKPLLAALAVTFAIAVTASVFAIWASVADAPWEDSGGQPGFTHTQVLRLTEGAVHEASSDEVACTWAEYQASNRVWVVHCRHIGASGGFLGVQSYVLDDETGSVDVPGS